MIAGGSGAVGRLFSARLRESGAEVCTIDPAPATGLPDGCRPLRGDITGPGPREISELATADLVLLAVPEPVAVRALPALAGVLRPGVLLADTLSVKRPMADAQAVLGPEVQTVGLNPMFAPALGFPGRPVAAVVGRDGERARELLRLVSSWGARVVPLTAERHDRITAASQALTHAAVLSFGLALQALDTDLAELAAVAPPPHTALLALLARIVSGTPEVYWDVQAGNPGAEAARTALADAAAGLGSLVRNEDRAGFDALLTRLAERFGPDLDGHRAVCAALFERLAPTGGPAPATPAPLPGTT
ncbi:hypothetical protein GCM10009716_10330 [Streptomyces sodiiphilus]|uniref:Prephenate/arogenate dehydrogenase domain-containing protein n=1 Tax=Streptomyces sodiiphilus TaxID=226217 RepID=A0ABP5A5Z1_9ACTN